MGEHFKIRDWEVKVQNNSNKRLYLQLKVGQNGEKIELFYMKAHCDCNKIEKIMKQLKI